MSHATYIADGAFSGDSSGNSVAYAYGSRGWGAVKARVGGRAVPGGGIAPSGEGVDFSQIGVEWQDYFVNGQLETADCVSAFGISGFSQAECRLSTSDRRFFRWTGTTFEVTRTILAWSPSFCLSSQDALRVVQDASPRGPVSYSPLAPRNSQYQCEKGWAVVNFDQRASGQRYAATADLQYSRGRWEVGDRAVACGGGGALGGGEMTDRLQRIGCGN